MQRPWRMVQRGAGAAVTRNIPDNVIAYGNPCKIVRLNNMYYFCHTKIQKAIIYGGSKRYSLRSGAF